jgi:F420-0:gamma-glutamyl ligase
MLPLQVTPLRTSVFHLGQDLNRFVLQSLPDGLREGAILAITSKIVSLAESRVVARSEASKRELVIAEADHDLGEVAFECRLTIKHGLFIPSSGIDESNSERDEFILYPKDPLGSAQRLYDFLAETFKLRTFGVLMTDSHTLPLRQGVTGIALAYWGFHGVRNLVGQTDLFGRTLRMTQMDLADGLAAAAVMMMGEATETCPLALIENATGGF